jgi:hypothetical protein
VATDIRWDALARALRELHRALVERARSDYLRENLIGGDIGPGELLRLLTTDPYFAWLRGLSELMVDIDVLRERPAQERDDIAPTVRAAVEFFITPASSPETAHEFGRRYWPYVQDDPHVAMAHAALKRALSTWQTSTNAPSSSDAREQVAQSARETKRRNGSETGS